MCYDNINTRPIFLIKFKIFLVLSHSEFFYHNFLFSITSWSWSNSYQISDKMSYLVKKIMKDLADLSNYFGIEIYGSFSFIEW